MESSPVKHAVALVAGLVATWLVWKKIRKCEDCEKASATPLALGTRQTPQISWARLNPHASNGQPCTRSSHGLSATSDKRVVLFGGEHVKSTPIDNQIWTLRVDGQGPGVWEVLATTGTAPPPRIAHAQAVIGDVLYVFGGWLGSMKKGWNDAPIDDLFRCDLASGTWSRVLPASATALWPPARSYHNLVADQKQGKLYLFGGCGADERLNDLYEYDVHTGTWTALPVCAALSGRGGAGMALVGRRLFVVGGFVGHELDELFSYDLDSRLWTQHAAPGLAPRSVMGIAAVGSHVLVFGGEGDPATVAFGVGGFLGDVLLLDTRDLGSGDSLQLKWCVPEPVADSAAPAGARGWGAAAALDDNTVVIFGGICGANDEEATRLNDAHVLRLGD